MKDWFPSWIRRFLIAVVIGLIFYFLIHSILSNWRKASFAEIKLEVNFLLTSFLFLLTSSLAGVFAWEKNLGLLGMRINYSDGLRTIAISQLGKYIPGKVWSFGGRVLLAKRYGVGEIETSASMFVEVICLSLASVVLFSFSLFSYGKGLPQRFYLLFLLLPTSVAFLHPRLLEKLIALGGKFLKREVILPHLKLKGIALVYFFYFLSWWIHTTGFFFLVRSFYPLPYGNYFAVVGAFSCSWVLSFAVFIVPAGLGAREGILTFLLNFFMPLPIAALASISGRLWTTAGEITMLIFAFLISPREFVRQLTQTPADARVKEGKTPL